MKQYVNLSLAMASYLKPCPYCQLVKYMYHIIS